MWAIGGLCLVVEILRLGFQLPYPAETSLKPGLNSDNNTILRRVECTANLVLPVTSSTMQNLRQGLLVLQPCDLKSQLAY